MSESSTRATTNFGSAGATHSTVSGAQGAEIGGFGTIMESQHINGLGMTDTWLRVGFHLLSSI
ncbi:hypothetical protein Scep_024166 [Stephania cephalantha]|uniref:Uncharacterized protein n=1 Tax=Stephania cephalantha TaxID=152367 RepID=A0AAP0EX69_9MAGN